MRILTSAETNQCTVCQMYIYMCVPLDSKPDHPSEIGNLCLVLTLNGSKEF